MQAPPTRFIAVLITAALLLVACGGADSTGNGNGVASLAEAEETSSAGDAAEGAGSEGDEPLAPEDAELAFAAYDDCMADAGFDFGATIAGDGTDGEGVAVQEIEVAGDDPQSGGIDAFDFGEEFQAAEEECRKHLDGLDLSFEMSPEEEAAFEDAQIEWAACMRERGIDVPDFDTSGGGAGVVIIGGPEDEGDPQGGGFSLDDFDVEAFEEANEECNSAFAELEERFGAEGQS